VILKTFECEYAVGKRQGSCALSADHETQGNCVTTTPVIAIVDDDATVRDALGLLVRSFDFAVELYGSGQELLAATSVDVVSCVVTDVQMPTMDGFALCAALRERGLDMPVIFMTAFVKEGYEQRARESEAACFLQKPFQDTDILRCIEHSLKRNRKH
jgi:FixJ family two-component response regulator